MRILVLSKRQYLGKDLLDDQFFRNYEVPEELNKLDHQVRGVTLSYRRMTEGLFKPGTVSWSSFNVYPWPHRYFVGIKTIIEEFNPDIIWASSDVYHSIFGYYLASKYRIPIVIDLYDNYESFGLSKIPGVRTLFRYVCRRANGLTVVSRMLRDYILSESTIEDSHVRVMGNAVRKDLFKQMPKADARHYLGLPSNVRLIGTAGALSAGRGIEVLFKAFMLLVEQFPELHLVVAGPRDKTLQQYSHPQIIDLGVLDFEKVPYVFNSLDVAVICNVDSLFGRYCFPQKYYEIAACETNVVASDVGEMRYLLRHNRDALFVHDSAKSLSSAIKKQLFGETNNTDIDIPSWSDRAEELSGFLESVKRGCL
ncbi:hypothetical protein BOW53_02135 [Solemya pervernicosa gill symbiont]|uniref:Glycosyltransferase subfamily 4-like N-terminal domain-containing protein n=1 Tax=Solemya pervernicosa gill symbiont TaxID=642797 RepID=A0A1T2L9Y5_9GAMM|nr:glycosyltransferase family 4 protein [Solemya pervernicosa gill symbiont]OOZ41822.1 hypothetical protein BOW53_02135 [Solemya pervernicosa gill symbiont]